MAQIVYVEFVFIDDPFEHRKPLLCIWTTDLVLTALALWKNFKDEHVPHSKTAGQQAMQFVHICWYTMMYAKLFLTVILGIAISMRNTRMWDIFEPMYSWLSHSFVGLSFFFAIISSCMSMFGLENYFMTRYSITFIAGAILPKMATCLYMSNFIADVVEILLELYDIFGIGDRIDWVCKLVFRYLILATE